jgi:hypothetical protein
VDYWLNQQGCGQTLQIQLVNLQQILELPFVVVIVIVAIVKKVLEPITMSIAGGEKSK